MKANGKWLHMSINICISYPALRAASPGLPSLSQTQYRSRTGQCRDAVGPVTGPCCEMGGLNAGTAVPGDAVLQDTSLPL